MSCSDCGEIISTSNIINHCLQEWRIPSFQESNHSIIGPIQLSHSPKRGWIWQHIHSHITWKMVVLSNKTHFGGIKMFRELLLKYRFEEHSAYHKASCFKKRCEC
jgi:hypothetical protein